MKKWGFIYKLGDATAPARWDTIGSEACVLVCVGVPKVADAADVAQQLVAQGCQLVEMCGAFSGSGLAAVEGAVGQQVPVGAVFYGGDAGTPLHRLFG